MTISIEIVPRVWQYVLTMNTTPTASIRRTARLAAQWGRLDGGIDRSLGGRQLAQTFRMAVALAEQDFDVDTSDVAIWDAFCGAYLTAYERAHADAHTTSRGYRARIGLSVARRDAGLGESMVAVL